MLHCKRNRASKLVSTKAKSLQIRRLMPMSEGRVASSWLYEILRALIEERLKIEAGIVPDNLLLSTCVRLLRNKAQVFQIHCIAFYLLGGRNQVSI